MNNPTKITKTAKSPEAERVALFRGALRFAGHSMGCEDLNSCRCGYDELCRHLAQAGREWGGIPDEAIELLKDCAADITGHKGDECEDQKCRCGLKKALRGLKIRVTATDQFVVWWCARCSREHEEKEVKSLWAEKDALTVPLDSTPEALTASNKEKCALGNCPAKNCPGSVRRSILSIRKTIPDVPF